MYPPLARSRIFAAVTCGDWLKSNSSIVFTRGSRASLIRRSIVFFSRSSISTVSSASRYARCVVFSRTACSASVLNCDADRRHAQRLAMLSDRGVLQLQPLGCSSERRRRRATGHIHSSPATAVDTVPASRYPLLHRRVGSDRWHEADAGRQRCQCSRSPVRSRSLVCSRSRPNCFGRVSADRSSAWFRSACHAA